MSVNEITRKYFDLERKRDVLASQKKFAALRKTYTGAISLENKNTGLFWDKKFGSKHEKFLDNPMERDRNKTASSLLIKLLKPGSRVMNIGCGDGNIESLIYGKTPEIDYLGIDVAATTLKNLAKRFPEFSFRKMDFLTTTQTSELEQKDVIMMFEVLEHMPPERTLEVLRKIHSLLKSGGKFLISVPMNEGLEQMFPYNPNEHLRCYTENIIKAELEMTGFCIKANFLFFAFPKFYLLKKVLTTFFFKTRWKPNNILIFAEKL